MTRDGIYAFGQSLRIAHEEKAFTFVCSLSLSQSGRTWRYALGRNNMLYYGTFARIFTRAIS